MKIFNECVFKKINKEELTTFYKVMDAIDSSIEELKEMKQKLSIKKVAIIGSGIMGSRIACHMANIGLDVLLLDIAPFSLDASEEKAGLTLDHPKVKNRL